MHKSPGFYLTVITDIHIISTIQKCPLFTTLQNKSQGISNTFKYTLEHNSTHQRALHCFGDFLESSEATRAHWFFPYFMTAALRISSSVFFHTPPLIMIRTMVALVLGCCPRLRYLLKDGTRESGEGGGGEFISKTSSMRRG